MARRDADPTLFLPAVISLELETAGVWFNLDSSEPGGFCALRLMIVWQFCGPLLVQFFLESVHLCFCLMMIVWLFCHLPPSFWLAYRDNVTSQCLLLQPLLWAHCGLLASAFAHYPICQVVTRTAAIFFGSFLVGNLAARDVFSCVS